MMTGPAGIAIRLMIGLMLLGVTTGASPGHGTAYPFAVVANEERKTAAGVASLSRQLH